MTYGASESHTCFGCFFFKKWKLLRHIAGRHVNPLLMLVYLMMQIPFKWTCSKHYVELLMPIRLHDQIQVVYVKATLTRQHLLLNRQNINWQQC